MILSMKRFLTACALALPLMASAADPLDINAATADQLASVLNGVGEAKADAIVAYREANGEFASVDQLQEVKGIGPALLEKNRVLIQVKDSE
ncbi:ComEA family DNA-binding protein [Marinomonas ostreistagni]|uniref:ComEA family DNA-binding protein n=1 Tax=Marinomonas ostreistagni TaxID=359209 RepID=UPI00194E073E|nr:ComEA family DNA-binding protein [Marinomonas ostreistagni]MBM6551733.1 helix-hairpin-helix domain-containing protein [Marinomonas ostreistagni]